MGQSALDRPSCKETVWKEMLPRLSQPFEAESRSFSEILWYADIFG